MASASRRKNEVTTTLDMSIPGRIKKKKTWVGGWQPNKWALQRKPLWTVAGPETNP